MSEKKPVVLALRPLHLVGLPNAGGRWEAFLAELAGRIGANERRGLLYGRFPNADAAVAAWGEAVEGAWGRDRKGPALPCPVQGILDLGGGVLSGSDFGEDSPLWDFLQPGLLHLTPGFEGRGSAPGPRGAAAVPNPVPGFDDLVRLESPDAPPAKRLVLLPAREALIGGELPVCFYCGSRDHGPAACPSKLLGPEVHALSSLAGRSLEDLAAMVHLVAADRAGAAQALASAVSEGTASDEPTVRALIGLLDLGRVFQLRFLWYLTFADAPSLPGPGPLKSVRVPGTHPLRLGLDCLRVGQLEEALARLGAPRAGGEGCWFQAEVARAFIALEQGRTVDAAHHLGRAIHLARNPEELAYAHLLLSRLHEVAGDAAGAERALDAAAEARPEWIEVVFRRLQLASGREPDEGTLYRVHRLASSGPETFIRLLLDPWLGPVRASADAMLAAIWESARRRAVARFGEARKECDALAQWLGPQGADLSFLEGALGRLESRLGQGYADDLRIAASAERLHVSAHRLKADGLERLRAEWDATRRKLEGLGRAWAGYPYPRWFGDFGSTLAGAQRMLRDAGELLGEGTAPAYRRASELLREIQPVLRRLLGALPDLAWVRALLDGVRDFGWRLARVEAAALLLGVGAPLALVAVAPAGSWAHELLAVRPGLWGLWAVCLGAFVAPVWAAGATLRSAERSRQAGERRLRLAAEEAMPRAAAGARGDP